MKIARILLLGLVALVTLGGCKPAASPTIDVLETAIVVDEDLPQDIDVAKAEELWAADAAVVIDVREESEFAEGHIPGAILIPLGTLPQRISEIPDDRPVIVVCRSGNRSNQATEFLRDEGLDNVHNMLGGMNAWGQAGYEIEK